MAVLNSALGETDRRSFPHLFNNNNDRITALNSLACYYLLASEYEPKSDQQEHLIENGINCVNLADGHNLTAPETLVTKNFFKLLQGKQDNVLNHYKDSFEHIGYDHPLIFLFRALLEFNKSNYQESLKSFKQTL